MSALRRATECWGHAETIEGDGEVPIADLTMPDGTLTGASVGNALLWSSTIKEGSMYFYGTYLPPDQKGSA